jgi:hypothetical protein
LLWGGRRIYIRICPLSLRCGALLVLGRREQRLEVDGGVGEVCEDEPPVETLRLLDEEVLEDVIDRRPAPGERHAAGAPSRKR